MFPLLKAIRRIKSMPASPEEQVTALAKAMKASSGRDFIRAVVMCVPEGSGAPCARCLSWVSARDVAPYTGHRISDGRHVCSPCSAILTSGMDDRYVMTSTEGEYRLLLRATAKQSRGWNNRIIWEEQREGAASFKDPEGRPVTREVLSHCSAAEVRLIAEYHTSKRRGVYFYDTPWTRRTGAYMGLELELDVRSDVIGTANRIFGTLGKGWYISSIERDGSVQGFECITHPTGLDRHREVLSRVKQLLPGRGESVSSCGLHVHVSRSMYTAGTLTKLLRLMSGYNMKRLLRDVARRDNNDRYSKWSIFHPHMKVHPRYQDSYDRYSALNLTNKDTVEWRVFKSSTCTTDVIAALEFVYHVTMFARDRVSFADESFKVSSGKDMHLQFLRYLEEPEQRPESAHLRVFLAQRGWAVAVSPAESLDVYYPPLWIRNGGIATPMLSMPEREAALMRIMPPPSAAPTPAPSPMGEVVAARAQGAVRAGGGPDWATDAFDEEV